MTALRHLTAALAATLLTAPIALTESPAKLPATVSFGVTEDGEGYEGVSWNILGQISQPKVLSKEVFAFESLSNPGDGVPVHVHLTQDVMILVQEGEIELKANDSWITLRPGDIARMPRGTPHGYFNTSDAPSRSLFWVTPTGKLKDLFVALDGLTDVNTVMALAAEHEVEFLPPEANER